MSIATLLDVGGRLSHILLLFTDREIEKCQPEPKKLQTFVNFKYQTLFKCQILGNSLKSNNNIKQKL